VNRFDPALSSFPHGDPRQVIQRVLADGRFQRAPQRPNEKTWLDLVRDALRELWHRITEPLNHMVGNSRLTTVIGILALVAVAALLTIVIAWFATRFRWRRVRAGPAPAATGFGADARALRSRALDAASAGRYHEAAALLWASALRALDEDGRVGYDPARTPGEWRRVVGDPNFDALARDAVVALFGDRGADAALVARMREAYDRVVVPA
jgi:hypothetical protein